MNVRFFSFKNRPAVECLPVLMGILVLMAIAIPRGLSAFLLIFALATLAACAPELSRVTMHTFVRTTVRRLQLPLIIYAALALFVFVSLSPRAFEMLRDSTLVVLSLSILFALKPLMAPVLQSRLLKYFTGALAIGFVYYIIQFAFDFPVDGWLNPRAAIYTVMTTNVPKRPATLLLLFMWPAALYLSTRKKYAAPALLLAVSIALLFFTSRASMIGALAGLTLCALTYLLPRTGRGIGITLVAFIIPLTIAFITVLPHIHTFFAPLLSNSGGTRLAIWDAALRLGTLEWPVGIGIDGSRIYAPSIPVHPHNAFLQIWLEFGLIGVALISFLLGMLAHTLRHSAKAAQPYLWGAAASAITVLSIAYGLWQGWWLAAHGLTAFMLALAASVMQQKAGNSAG